ncbi:MAG: type II and III secretion system protein [Thiotrichales bacterium]|nr:type II and III secretion system protein [Thiotrichales bacterium]
MHLLKKSIFISLLVLGVSSCSEIEPKPFEPSPAHINKDQETSRADIPELVEQTPILPVPEPVPDLEKYTVVVNEVPVKELLFALARDAEINVDIAPSIGGVVTINAVEQTLPQILDRISNQVDMRYEFSNGNLIIAPDQPFFRSYKVDYVNMSRNTDSTITIATQIATTGSGFEDTGGGSAGGNNNSTTDVNSISNNQFWRTLVSNIMAIIGEETGASGTAGEIPSSINVIPSPETGIMTVNASARQHAEIQRLIDQVTDSAQRQVMVQATIVEVTLNDQYQAGIDWSFIDTMAGLDIVSTTLGAVPTLGGIPLISSLLLTYSDSEVGEEGDALNATVRALNEFGDTRVLSSPQLMVLNNQTAVLKVVDNVVFFTIEPETNQTQGVQSTTFETTVHTVPVGIVMSITPYISDSDSVILNVRPTISRISQFKNDPNPALTTNLVTGGALATPIVNPIPEIQVREMESMLRMNNGQIAVLGGLMQDENRDTNRAIPGLSKIPVAGKAFQTDTVETFKTELVIFLRPIVVRNPSLDGDLDLYSPYLEQGAVPATWETGGS